MKIVIDTKTTRYELENPFAKEDYKKRLIKSRAIDLRDNHIIEDLQNGYSRITPIDRTKIYK